jgi:hypothetical protein
MSYRPLSINVRLTLAACILSVTQLVWADSEPTVVRLSEPVAITETHETFGAVIPDRVSAMTLSALIAEPEKHTGENIVVEARVAQVCQKKGCFFIAQDGATTVRVSFIDYSFFVPTDIGGRRVTLVGKLERVDLSEEEASHLENDLASADADVAPGPQYEIVASAVRVPKT